MNKAKLIGLFISVLTIIGAIYISTKRIAVFIDVPSFAFVVLLTLGGLLFKFGFNGLMFWKNPETSKFGGKICIYAGYLGAVIGFVIIGSSLTDLAALGPAIAVALLTILYSYLFYFFLFAPFEEVER